MKAVDNINHDHIKGLFNKQLITLTMITLNGLKIDRIFSWQSLITVIRLMLSIYLGPKMITLSQRFSN
jgi:hypothetical protein